MRLDKMTKSEFEFWAARSKAAYAQDKIRANNLTEEEATNIAENDFRNLLPGGFTSKDNYLFTMKLDDGSVVGYLWLCVRGASNNRKAFVADIIVEEGHRGKGYGRKAMELAEVESKKLGLKEIGLHVFGFNEPAIRLYQSLGYQTTDLVMSKKLK